jgi:hypothetical protein
MCLLLRLEEGGPGQVEGNRGRRKDVGIWGVGENNEPWLLDKNDSVNKYLKYPSALFLSDFCQTHTS